MAWISAWGNPGGIGVGGSGRCDPPHSQLPRGGRCGAGGVCGLKTALPEGAAGCCSPLGGARNCAVLVWRGGRPGVSRPRESVWSRSPGSPRAPSRRQPQPQEKEPRFTMAQSSPGRAARAEPPLALKKPEIGFLRAQGPLGAALPSAAPRESRGCCDITEPGPAG